MKREMKQKRMYYMINIKYINICNISRQLRHKRTRIFVAHATFAYRLVHRVCLHGKTREFREPSARKKFTRV